MGIAESALIVEVPEAESAIGHWRLEHDPVTTQGIPAHVTVLYPFAAPDDLDDDAIDALRSVCGSVASFGYTLDTIERFPDVVWLHPAPGDPFRRLTAAIWDAFPAYSPYEGRFPDPQPHVTVGRVAEPDQPEFVDRLAAEIGPMLPIRCRVDTVSLFTDDGDGTWRRRRRFPLAPAT